MNSTATRNRRAPGRRQARQARERARRRRRRRLAGLAAAALVAFLAAAALLPGRDGDGGPDKQADPHAVAQPEQLTLLLVRHAEQQATSVTLLAATVGERDARAGVVFVPTGTLVDVPGFGSEQLGMAYRYGGAELVEASVENALGIVIDHVAGVSDAGLAAFLGRTGGLSLDLPERLVDRAADGTAAVRFTPGPQVLDGGRLAEVWGFRERGEEELAAFPRQQLVWGALLDAVAADAAVLDRLLEAGAPQLETDAEPATLRRLLGELAEARSAGRLTFTLLPVEPFGGGSVVDGGSTYRVAARPARELVADLLAASVPSGGGDGALRVQVLNGVGLPGIGQEVDRRLEGAGMRIVLSDNARSFDFATTRVLVYDESPEMLAAARRVRDLLGVGSIAVSRQPQSVVDLTIVVGADFLAHTAPASSEEAAGAGTTTPTPEQTS